MNRAMDWRCFLAVSVLAMTMSCSGGGGGDSAKSGSSNSGSQQSGSSQSGSSQSGSSQGSETIQGQQGETTGGSQVKIKPEAQKRVDMRTVTVEPRQIPQTLTVAGQIVMNEEKTVHIGVYASGRITQLRANIGDAADQGEVLARMHSHDVHETIAAYNTALQEVDRQEQLVDYQRRMRDRMARLFQLKSASPQEVERTEADLRSAQTNLHDAHYSVTKEAEHLSDILGLPKSQLGHITDATEQVPIVSPINGTVMDRKVTLGTVVDPGMEVYTVSDLSSVWMLASVNETDIAKVRVGDEVQLMTQAYPDKAFQGRVLRVGPQFDPQTRTLLVRIVVPNPHRDLKPEMYVSAQVYSGGSKKSIIVPEVAVQNINGGSVVFVKTSDDTFEVKPVEIARRMNGQAEIGQGLKPGDAVVTQGSFVVKSEMLKSQIGQ